MNAVRRIAPQRAVRLIMAACGKAVRGVPRLDALQYRGILGDLGVAPSAIEVALVGAAEDAAETLINSPADLALLHDRRCSARSLLLSACQHHGDERKAVHSLLRSVFESKKGRV